MPKIIGNLRENILKQSREILFRSGYHELSIRAIAEACGVAVGTIYNYYENKDTIVAYVMMEDWEQILSQMEEKCRTAASVEDGCCEIFSAIRCFEARFRPVFLEYAGTNENLGIYGPRHLHLRGQLEDMLFILVSRFSVPDKALITITAEAILAIAKQQEFNEESVRLLVSKLLL